MIAFRDRSKFRADRKAQRVLRHLHRAPVVRDHLPHKIPVDIVCGAGPLHIPEHPSGDLLKTALIQAELLPGIFYSFASAQRRLHIRNAPGLRLYDMDRDILQRNKGRVLQEVPGQLDRRFMICSGPRRGAQKKGGAGDTASVPGPALYCLPLDPAGAVAAGELFHLVQRDPVEVPLDGVLQRRCRHREFNRLPAVLPAEPRVNELGTWM